MKKKPLIIGIAIGVLVRPILVRAYRPLHKRMQINLYNFAFDFIQNFDANHPS